jgi:hypothetical protein
MSVQARRGLPRTLALLAHRLLIEGENPVGGTPDRVHRRRELLEEERTCRVDIGRRQKAIELLQISIPERPQLARRLGFSWLRDVPFLHLELRLETSTLGLGARQLRVGGPAYQHRRRRVLHTLERVLHRLRRKDATVVVLQDPAALRPERRERAGRHNPEQHDRDRER